ncbi:putative membrane protein [Caldalkalibacillus uzonensis]|uniref:Membrane protein n=1 Tax=Caldalkalibacillus uzonensis TaxID=353224 RepID=A0ABU0CX67_9BACI|nr:hypothetical protein [Caldalkalibacillus uzonensis]MDQ0339722.1 putative membrane protein [Caldalkalibacillus uzonensis]
MSQFLGTKTSTMPIRPDYASALFALTVFVALIVFVALTVFAAPIVFVALTVLGVGVIVPVIVAVVAVVNQFGFRTGTVVA